MTLGSEDKSLGLEILPFPAVFAQSQEAVPGSHAIPGLGTLPKSSFLLGPISKTRGIWTPGLVVSACPAEVIVT